MLLRLIRASALRPAELLEQVELRAEAGVDLEENCRLARALVQEAGATPVCELLRTQAFPCLRSSSGSVPACVLRLVLRCAQLYPEADRAVREFCVSEFSGLSGCDAARAREPVQVQVQGDKSGGRPAPLTLAVCQLAMELWRGTATAVVGAEHGMGAADEDLEFRGRLSRAIEGLVRAELTGELRRQPQPPVVVLVGERTCSRLGSLLGSELYASVARDDPGLAGNLWDFVLKLWGSYQEMPAAAGVLFYTVALESYPVWADQGAVDQLVLDRFVLGLARRGLTIPDQSVWQRSLALLQSRCVRLFTLPDSPTKAGKGKGGSGDQAQAKEHGSSPALARQSQRSPEDRWTASQWSSFVVLVDRTLRGESHLLEEVRERLVTQSLCADYAMFPFLQALLMGSRSFVNMGTRQGLLICAMEQLSDAPADQRILADDPAAVAAICGGDFLTLLCDPALFKKHRDEHPSGLPPYAVSLQRFLGQLHSQRMEDGPLRDRLIRELLRRGAEATNPTLQMILLNALCEGRPSEALDASCYPLVLDFRRSFERAGLPFLSQLAVVIPQLVFRHLRLDDLRGVGDGSNNPHQPFSAPPLFWFPVAGVLGKARVFPLVAGVLNDGADGKRVEARVRPAEVPPLAGEAEPPCAEERGRKGWLALTLPARLARFLEADGDGFCTDHHRLGELRSEADTLGDLLVFGRPWLRRELVGVVLRQFIRSGACSGGLLRTVLLLGRILEHAGWFGARRFPGAGSHPAEPSRMASEISQVLAEPAEGGQGPLLWPAVEARLDRLVRELGLDDHSPLGNSESGAGAAGSATARLEICRRVCACLVDLRRLAPREEARPSVPAVGAGGASAQAARQWLCGSGSRLSSLRSGKVTQAAILLRAAVNSGPWDPAIRSALVRRILHEVVPGSRPWDRKAEAADAELFLATQAWQALKDAIGPWGDLPAEPGKAAYLPLSQVLGLLDTAVVQMAAAPWAEPLTLAALRIAGHLLASLASASPRLLVETVLPLSQGLLETVFRLRRSEPLARQIFGRVLGLFVQPAVFGCAGVHVLDAPAPVGRHGGSRPDGDEAKAAEEGSGACHAADAGGIPGRPQRPGLSRCFAQLLEWSRGDSRFTGVLAAALAHAWAAHPGVLADNHGCYFPLLAELLCFQYLPQLQASDPLSHTSWETEGDAVFENRMLAGTLPELLAGAPAVDMEALSEAGVRLVAAAFVSGLAAEGDGGHPRDCRKAAAGLLRYILEDGLLLGKISPQAAAPLLRWRRNQGRGADALHLDLAFEGSPLARRQLYLWQAANLCSPVLGTPESSGLAELIFDRVVPMLLHGRVTPGMRYLAERLLIPALVSQPELLAEAARQGLTPPESQPPREQETPHRQVSKRGSNPSSRAGGARGNPPPPPTVPNPQVVNSFLVCCGLALVELLQRTGQARCRADHGCLAIQPNEPLRGRLEWFLPLFAALLAPAASHHSPTRLTAHYLLRQAVAALPPEFAEAPELLPYRSVARSPIVSGSASAELRQAEFYRTFYPGLPGFGASDLLAFLALRAQQLGELRTMVVHWLRDQQRLPGAAGQESLGSPLDRAGFGLGATTAAESSPEALFPNLQQKIDGTNRLFDLFEESSGDAASSSDARSFSSALDGLDDQGSRRHQLVVVASLLSKAPNLAGLTRTAEVFGVDAVVLHDRSVVATPEFARVSVSAHRWMRFLEVPRGCPGDPESSAQQNPLLAAWIRQQRSEGWQVVGLEQTQQSRSLVETEFPFAREAPAKLILLVGAEKTGIPTDLLNLLDFVVEIPQFGRIRSLNAHVSASIVIWESVRQRVLAGRRLAAAAAENEQSLQRFGLQDNQE